MYIDNYIDDEKVKEMLGKLRYIIQKDKDLEKQIKDTAAILYDKNDPDDFVQSVNMLKENSIQKIGELTNVLSLLCFEQGLDKLIDFQRRRGINDEITRASFFDLNQWIKNYYIENGRPGFVREAWLVRHFMGVYYRIGKLQYEIMKYQEQTMVFSDGENIIVVAIEGLGIDNKGELNEENPYKFTTFYESIDEIIAHTVEAHTGLISLNTESIDKMRYKKVLCKDDYILNVHIPSDGSLNIDDCEVSYQQAKIFFQKHFPEYNFKAFTCYSWILSNELISKLHPYSNIVRFAKSYIRNICKVQQEYFYKWIFGFDFKGVDSVEAKSSLQKLVVELERQEIQIFSRGGFILIET